MGKKISINFKEKVSVLHKDNTSISGNTLKTGCSSPVSGAKVELTDESGKIVTSTMSTSKGTYHLIIPDTVNLNQNFTLTVSKETNKNYWNKTKYKGESFLITYSDINKNKDLLLKETIKRRHKGKRNMVIAGAYS
jgi:uncharacterized protein YfaS (alpha-2-macroglobulin family)